MRSSSESGRRGPGRASAYLAVALALAAAPLVAQGRPQGKGQGGDHRAETGQILNAAFDIGGRGDAIQVGEKGKAKREMGVEKVRGPKNVGVKLTERGGKGGGAQSSFAYDEETHTVTVGAGGREVPIVIQADHAVRVGGTTCPPGNVECIGETLFKEAPALRSEDVAAMLAVANDDLHGMADGELIATAMLDAAARGQKRSVDGRKAAHVEEIEAAEAAMEAAGKGKGRGKGGRQ